MERICQKFIRFFVYLWSCVELLFQKDGKGYYDPMIDSWREKILNREVDDEM